MERTPPLLPATDSMHPESQTESRGPLSTLSSQFPETHGVAFLVFTSAESPCPGLSLLLALRPSEKCSHYK